MHTVPLTHQLVTIQDDFDLDKIIESGQCFRPQKLADGRYRFLSGGALLYLTPLGAGQYDAAWYGSDWECWANYFDLGRNYAAPRGAASGRDRAAIWTNRSNLGRASESCIRPMGNAHHLSYLPAQEHSGHPHRRRTVRCRGEPLSAEGDEVFLFPTPQQLCGLSERS